MATPEQRSLGIAKMEARKQATELTFSEGLRQSRDAVRDALLEITQSRGLDTGPNWSSNALRPEIAEGIEQILAQCHSEKPLDYLEIGSCQGASMGLIGHLTRANGRLGSLTSVDPYLDGGYEEDDGFVKGERKFLRYDQEILEVARSLYNRLGLEVDIHREFSDKALLELERKGRKFDLIYIDGNHGGFFPIKDFCNSMRLIRVDGIIILDYHMYPDIGIIKEQSEKYLEKIFENWKIAAFRVSEEYAGA